MREPCEDAGQPKETEGRRQRPEVCRAKYDPREGETQDKPVCGSVPQITVMIMSFKPKRLTQQEIPFIKIVVPAPWSKEEQQFPRPHPHLLPKPYPHLWMSTCSQENLPEPQRRQELPCPPSSTHSVSSPTRDRPQRGLWRPSFLRPPRAAPQQLPAPRKENMKCFLVSHVNWEEEADFRCP